MASDALPVPDDLKPVLERHAGIDWGRVAWDAVRERAARVERADRLARRSVLTSKQARDLGFDLRGP